MENIDLTQGPIDAPPQRNPSTFQFSLKWALILALAGIVFSLFLYLTNQYDNRGLGMVMYLIMGGVSFLAVKNFRDKELGGYITFGKGFSVGFQTIFYAGILMSVYTFIFFKFIDADMVSQMLQKVEQGMLDKNMPEEQIEMGMKYTRMFMTPGMMAVWGLAGSAFVGAIISLIVAAIARKENKQLLPPQ